MKDGTWALVPILCGLAASSATALEALEGHTDLRCEYDEQAGEWSWDAVVRDSGDQVVDTRSLDEVFMPARDVDWPQGERNNDPPTGSDWEFLGVAEGDPVWILPDSFLSYDPGYAYTELGFRNDQSGVFASYVDSDPRAGTAAQDWITVRMGGVVGPDGGEFSVFDFGAFGQPPTVWTNTLDDSQPSPPPDLFLFGQGNHTHVNWAFSKKGVYRVQLTAEAYLGPGMTNKTPVSDPVDVFLSVGPHAKWRAEHFDADTVLDEAVAGDDADPDHDGLVNLVEYALGGDPWSGVDTHPVSGESVALVGSVAQDSGTDYLTVTFHRRVFEAYPEVDYAVQWSGDLSEGSWTDSGVEVQVDDLNDEWQRVTVRDTVAVGGTPRFARVQVTAL
jgi:surface-anchored protein